MILGESVPGWVEAGMSLIGLIPVKSRCSALEFGRPENRRWPERLPGGREPH